MSTTIQLPELEKLTGKKTSELLQLKTLDLHWRQLKTLPSEIGNLTNLEHLLLYSNQLQTLPSEIGRLTNLSQLVLNKNQLVTLPKEITNLTKLNFLDISANQLTSVPSEFGQLTKLESLNLSSNRLDNLPVELCLLPKTTMYVDDNPLKGIEKEIVRQGMKGILAFLEEAKNGKSEWKECKVMFVGEENVGKTSLLTCFKSSSNKLKKGAKNVSTNGIAMSEWKTTQTKIQCWDFGGQTVFYPTHEFFLSGRSIYLVVFNLMKINESRVDYWLKKIRTLTYPEPARVFLIGTHYDEFTRSSPEVQQHAWTILKELSQRISQIKLELIGQSFVSCTDGSGIAELRQKVVEEAEKSLHFTELPTSWIRLLELLRKERSKRMKNDILASITWKEFHELAVSCHILAKNVVDVAQFLHDTGNVVHFHDTKAGLEDLVILNPQELANVMSCVISFNPKWKDGMITTAQLKQAWKSYSKDVSKLTSLLERFEVAFRMKNNKDTVFLPSLLPETKPSHVKDAWRSDRENLHRVARIYEFGFVPLGLFSRLMTRLIHQFQQQMNQEKLVCWRNGMLIQMNAATGANIQFLLEFNQERRLLKIKAQWKSLPSSIAAENSFSSMIQAIETLLENYYSREMQENEEQVKRWIPCSNCLATKKKYKKFIYEEAVRSVTANSSLYCTSCLKSIRIDFLAPDIAFAGIPIIQAKDLVIGEQIGTGGFGVVYKGIYTPSPGQAIEVAIKELRFSSTEDSSSSSLEKFEEFKREAFLMSCLNHKNLVKLYGVTLSPKLSMVMEFIKGGDLHHNFHHPDPQLKTQLSLLKVDKKQYEQEWTQFMTNLAQYSEKEKQENFSSFEKRRKDLETRQETIVEEQNKLDESNISWRLRYRVSLDIAKGLRYLHTIMPPIVHRDLRSPNIFLVNLMTMDEDAPITCKVADFGLSRQAAPQLKELLPTFQWLAPEVIDASSFSGYDERADVYSFGIVCWEIANNMSYAPFSEYKLPESVIKQKIIDENLRPTIPKTCPKEFAQMMEKCWITNPKLRPTIDEVVEQLAELLGLPTEMDQTL